MKRLLLLLIALTVLVSFVSAAIPPGDTLSKAYLDAARQWLDGRAKLAEYNLRQIVARSASVQERDNAKALLLDEFYFWPGKYSQYLQLSDSLNLRTGFYETTKLLAEQPPLKISLTGESLQLPFTLKNKAHVVVTMLINNKPVRLAVDTGAQRTFVTGRAARQASVKKLVDMQINNYNQKSVPAWLGLADSLRLDGLTIQNLPVFVSSVPIPGIDGLLGWDVLRQFIVVIDYPNQQLTLRKSRPDSTLNVNLLGGSVPMLLLTGPAKESLLLQLDTGSNEYLRLSPLGTTKVGLYQTGKKLSVNSSVGQPLRIRREKYAKNLAIKVDGKTQQFNRTPFFDVDSNIGIVSRDGLIGGRAFLKGTLTLDAPNHHYSYVPE